MAQQKTRADKCRNRDDQTKDVDRRNLGTKGAHQRHRTRLRRKKRMAHRGTRNSRDNQAHIGDVGLFGDADNERRNDKERHLVEHAHTKDNADDQKRNRQQLNTELVNDSVGNLLRGTRIGHQFSDGCAKDNDQRKRLKRSAQSIFHGGDKVAHRDAVGKGDKNGGKNKRNDAVDFKLNDHGDQQDYAHQHPKE